MSFSISVRLLSALLLLCSVATPVAAQDAPKDLSEVGLPVSAVLPGASNYELEKDLRYITGRDPEGNVVGWVAMSTSLVDIKAYSGKPLVTLVGLSPEGVITGAQVVHHSEPILLVGIPEQALTDFVSFYKGKHATDHVVVGGANRPDALVIDAISGATVTALVQNRTILETARKLGSAVGVVKLAELAKGRFIEEPEIWSFQEIWEKGAMGRLVVTQEQMHKPGGDAPFVDLVYTIADAPQVGKALLGEREYEYRMADLEPGEHLLVVLGNGSDSFKGSAFVRGGVFDRVRLEQGLREIVFRDTDYYNLSGTPAVGAPRFKEGAIFVVREGLLDPGVSFDLVFLGSRYDKKTAFSREFLSFKSSHLLPKSVYVSERPEAEPIWVGIWKSRIGDVGVLLVFLFTVTMVFALRRYSTASIDRLKWMHKVVLLVAFLLLGVHMNAQPSYTQFLTFTDSVVREWRWELFLTEPLIFISWIFIALVSVSWGRGVYCGWVCPYGALTELIYKLGELVKVRHFELPDRIHRPVRYLRFAIAFGLIPIYLYDSILAEKLAEIEPFKSTFFVPAWTRHPGFLAWWAFLLIWSVVAYRPFCRYLCPLGGVLAAGNMFRFSGPRRRKFCSSCKICTKGCEPMAIRPDGTIDPADCLSCMECEANYRSDEVCPPLISIERLTAKSKKAPLTEHEGKKLKLMQDESVTL